MSTRVDEIADGIFRISTSVAVPAIPDGFTFNQILVRAAAPLLFHTGLRSLFEATRAAIGSSGWTHPRAPRVGCRPPLGVHGPHALLRGSVHPARLRAPAGHRRGHPWSQRGHASGHGLLRLPGQGPGHPGPLVKLRPDALATVHGSSFRGDGASLLQVHSMTLAAPAGAH